jgi:hypothetical protein
VGQAIRSPRSTPASGCGGAAYRSRHESALAAGDKWLDPVAATRLLAAYAILVASALLARDPAAAAAAQLLKSGSTVVERRMSMAVDHQVLFSPKLIGKIDAVPFGLVPPP